MLQCAPWSHDKHDRAVARRMNGAAASPPPPLPPMLPRADGAPEPEASAAGGGGGAEGCPNLAHIDRCWAPSARLCTTGSVGVRPRSPGFARASQGLRELGAALARDTAAGVGRCCSQPGNHRGVHRGTLHLLNRSGAQRTAATYEAAPGAIGRCAREQQPNPARLGPRAGALAASGLRWLTKLRLLAPAARPCGPHQLRRGARDRWERQRQPPGSPAAPPPATARPPPPAPTDRRRS